MLMLELRRTCTGNHSEAYVWGGDAQIISIMSSGGSCVTEFATGGESSQPGCVHD